MMAKYALLVRDNENQEWAVHCNRLLCHRHELAYEYKTYIQKYPDKHVIPVEIHQITSESIEISYERHMAMEAQKRGRWPE